VVAVVLIREVRPVSQMVVVDLVVLVVAEAVMKMLLLAQIQVAQEIRLP
jgi:hypothetical protein